MASATFVRGASLDQEVDAEFASLFQGIMLPKEVVDRARDIVTRCATDRRALPTQMPERRPLPTGDPGMMIPGLWGRMRVLHAARDAALSALLVDDRERQMFAQNADAIRRQIEAARPDWAT